VDNSSKDAYLSHLRLSKIGWGLGPFYVAYFFFRVCVSDV